MRLVVGEIKEGQHHVEQVEEAEAHACGEAHAPLPRQAPLLRALCRQARSVTRGLFLAQQGVDVSGFAVAVSVRVLSVRVVPVRIVCEQQAALDLGLRHAVVGAQHLCV